VDAVRCLECGETRWSLFGGAAARLAGQPCEACGGETVVERRRPGTRPRKPFVERRDREKTPTPGRRERA
jgi:translation initiation factor 2 beta subunit (eIF-2beta)/eIF-5